MLAALLGEAVGVLAAVAMQKLARLAAQERRWREIGLHDAERAPVRAELVGDPLDYDVLRRVTAHQLENSLHRAERARVPLAEGQLAVLRADGVVDHAQAQRVLIRRALAEGRDWRQLGIRDVVNEQVDIHNFGLKPNRKFLV